MPEKTFQHLGKSYTVPEHSFYRVSLKLLVRNKAGKVLLVKNDEGRWAVPGGGWDQGETIEECIRREIMEELGVGVKSFDHQPLAFWVGQSSRGNYLTLKILVAGELESEAFVRSDEASETKYFTPEDMEKLIFDADEKGIIDVCRSKSIKTK